MRCQAPGTQDGAQGVRFGALAWPHRSNGGRCAGPELVRPPSSWLFPRLSSFHCPLTVLSRSFPARSLVLCCSRADARLSVVASTVLARAAYTRTLAPHRTQQSPLLPRFARSGKQTSGFKPGRSSSARIARRLGIDRSHARWVRPTIRACARHCARTANRPHKTSHRSASPLLTCLAQPPPR